MTAPLTHLIERFAPADAISRAEFREYIGISVSTDWRAQRAGRYPRLVKINNREKILLTDLAKFLDAGGSSAPKQGRPIGSRNKPKSRLEVSHA